MTESFSVETLIAAGAGALIAVYVILGVVLALGVFALVRLFILAKKTKETRFAPAEPSPVKEERTQETSAEEVAPAECCDSCDKLREKDREIAELKERIKELETRSEPAPEVVEEKTLKESLVAAREHGAVGLVTKKSILAHLSETFGEKVELNGRENRTSNGRLPLSDNHFALAGKKRVCFTYVYEDEGRVVMIVRLSEKGAAAIHKAHKATVLRSAFPKNKDRDWYSIIVDDSFTDAQAYAVLEEAYDYVLTK